MPAEDVKSKVDVLKARLSPFVKEGTSETSLKVPNRLLIGFKLDAVAVAIMDLLHEKYHKILSLVGYEPYGDSDYLFTYKVV
jgi:hypothetical protein